MARVTVELFGNPNWSLDAHADRRERPFVGYRTTTEIRPQDPLPPPFVIEIAIRHLVRELRSISYNEGIVGPSEDEVW